MPQSQTEVEETKRQPQSEEIERWALLVDKVRKSTNKATVNIAFEELVESLEPRMKNLCRKFKIHGLSDSDLLQEALYALRYKAIKDYDETRGTGTGPAPFDRFALLCIRRHLATELKTSKQIRKIALNTAVSLDQERSESSDELSLMNILPHSKGDVLLFVERKEYYSKLVKKLLSKLSNLEKEVFILHLKRYTYDQIAEIINKNRAKARVNIKGVDNALSRIKNKAEGIFQKHGEKDVRVRDATKAKEAAKRSKKAAKQVDNALTRIKRKAEELQDSNN